MPGPLGTGTESPGDVRRRDQWSCSLDESRQQMNRDALFRLFPALDTNCYDLREVPLSSADDLFRIRSHPEGVRLGPDAWTDLKLAEHRIREWHKWFSAKEDVPWDIFLRGEEFV